MDDLFSDLASSVVDTVQSGKLQKLGGRGKNKWEEREFELTNTGLTWAAPSAAAGLKPDEMASVRAGEDVAGKPSFVVVTNVKKGKEYQLVASDEAERDEWVGVINDVLIGVSSSKQGSLLKLGGRNKDVWQPRDFSCSRQIGLEWAAKSAAENLLSANEMVRTAAAPQLRRAARELTDTAGGWARVCGRRECWRRVVRPPTSPSRRASRAARPISCAPPRRPCAPNGSTR